MNILHVFIATNIVAIFVNLIGMSFRLTPPSALMYVFGYVAIFLLFLGVSRIS